MARVLLLLLLLAGCKPVIRYVPEPCPPPPALTRPKLPIEAWAPGKFTKEQVESLLWQSLALEVGYARSLEAALAAYAPKK